MIPISNRFRAQALTAVLGMAAIACSDSGPNGPADVTTDVTALNFFEQEFVGLWSRFHAYDGSTQYIRFDADRTGCKWEEAGGSNLRTDKTSYASWQIDANDPTDRMEVVVEGAGLLWLFNYPEDKIWPSGYTNLTRYRNSSGKACES